MPRRSWAIALGGMAASLVVGIVMGRISADAAERRGAQPSAQPGAAAISASSNEQPARVVSQRLVWF